MSESTSPKAQSKRISRQQFKALSRAEASPLETANKWRQVLALLAQSPAQSDRERKARRAVAVEIKRLEKLAGK